MNGVIYKSKAPLGDRGSAALVITCSSNVLAPSVREFLGQHLDLPEGTYDTLAVPGGPQFLLLTEYLPKFAWAGHRWVKFLIEKHRIKHVVLITHEDCAWHDDERMIPLLHRLSGEGGDSSKDSQLRELRRMTQAIHELLTPLVVDAYFAQKEADGTVAFLRVA